MDEQREILATLKQAKDKAVKVRQEESKLLSTRQDEEHQKIDAKNREERLCIKCVLKDYLEKKEKILDGEIEEEKKRLHKEK